MPRACELTLTLKNISFKLESMQVKFLLSLLMVCFLSLQAFSESGIIRGTVSNSDGKSAEFINIALKGKNKGAITKELHWKSGNQILIFAL